MSEMSYLWTTGGAGDGAIPYTRADWANITKVMSAMLSAEGVAVDYGESLSPYPNGLNSVQIGTGGAVVDGKPYNNTARVNITIPSAVGAGNSRIDRVVLRADWAAQTVRLTRIAGTDAANPTVPGIAQNSGATYDIALCQVRVDTSGNCTITDERARSQIGNTGIKALAISSSQIAAGAVDNSKIGARVPILPQRVGGDPSNWMTPGTTIYTVGDVLIQAGIVQTTILNGQLGAELTINFPVPYLDSPLIFLTPQSVMGPTGAPATAGLYRWSPNGGYASQFIAHVGRPDGITGDYTACLAWLAIGAVA